MNDRPESITYIARASCGCIKLTMSHYVDFPLPAIFAKKLAWAVTSGYDLKQVPTPEEMPECSSCDVCSLPTPPKPVQESLLEILA